MELVTGLYWSPDGRELAWVPKGTLWRMPVDGSEPIRIGELGKEDAALVHWGSDGRLLTTTDSVSRWWWVDCPPVAKGPLGEPRPTPFTSAENEFGPGGTVAWLAQEGQVESQLVRVSPDGALRALGRRHEGALIPAPQIADGRRLLFGLAKGAGVPC